MSDNPFLALFEASPAPKADLSLDESDVSHRQHLSDLLEDLFQFTINPFKPEEKKKNRLVLSLDGTAGQSHALQTWLDLPSAERALTDRLMMQDEELPNGQERCRVRYLGEAYRRSLQHRPPNRLDEAVRKRLVEVDLPAVRAAVCKNLATALLLPEMYPTDANLSRDLMGYLTSQDDVFSDGMSLDQAAELLESVAREMEKEDREEMERIVKGMLAGLKEGLDDQFCKQLDVKGLMLFSRTPLLARCLAFQTFPRDPLSGRSYADTLLGALLCNSCIPKTELGEYEFFERPSSQPAGVMAKEEERVQAALADLHERAHAVFKGILTADDEAKHLLLLWIGDCLKANAGRGKLWNSEMGALMSNSFASDGFMLNLGSVLLRLCAPFTSGARNKRLLKIDVTYSASDVVVSEDALLKGVHSRGIKEDTCVCTAADFDHERVPSPGQFNFITDVFFLAQKSLDLGFKVVQEKFVKLNQELNRQQNLHREAMQQNPEIAEQIQGRMERAMTRYLTLKAALLEPETLKRMMDMSTATATLMVQLALKTETATLPTGEMTPLAFPLEETATPPPGLFYIPEHFVENLCEHLLVAKRFKPSSFEEAGGDSLGEILNFVLVFMGDSRLMKNPHLRARLAECLECLLPHHTVPGQNASFGGFNREQLFLTHEHRLQIVPSLLSVFVSIEETGQAVEFEYKFSYRRPMYDVIKYLWEMEDFRAKFQSLALDSEAHIDDESAPLFLRFVNLLINDAIFLLDEALGYMRQIGDQQAERPGWQELSAQERAQNEGQYQHMGRLARYHNIMGKETIEMLHRLTSEIQAVFTHATMVDRIAAMLNYFLKTLVGPERKNLKVADLEEFEFRPGDIVHTICSIYAQFESCDDFLAAVSRDGRSYSQDLFSQAERVLVKIGRTDIIGQLQDVAKKVRSSAESQQADDALFSDAPDHFLDALMFILMKDPVKLPASGQIVDRQTISRHLLSDQTDPFNRAPLSLDKVIPMDELKKEIQEWMESKRREGRK